MSALVRVFHHSQKRKETTTVVQTGLKFKVTLLTSHMTSASHVLVLLCVIISFFLFLSLLFLSPLSSLSFFLLLLLKINIRLILWSQRPSLQVRHAQLTFSKTTNKIYFMHIAKRLQQKVNIRKAFRDKSLRAEKQDGFELFITSNVSLHSASKVLGEHDPSHHTSVSALLHTCARTHTVLVSTLHLNCEL